MTKPAQLVPTSSQTVGPYFRIGLEHLIEPATEAQATAAGSVEIRGQVLDGEGLPVPDAMLEFWGADSFGTYSCSSSQPSGSPAGFHRVATDDSGTFSVTTVKPGPVPLSGGGFQAPHLVVLVFARGLLRNLITRVYFSDEPGNATDLVLGQVPEDRRRTLIANGDGQGKALFHWNIILQGKDETAFFAW
jgi:protocatechuate 3,4-dioxygenase alpha subunit